MSLYLVEPLNEELDCDHEPILLLILLLYHAGYVFDEGTSSIQGLLMNSLMFTDLKLQLF